MKPKRYSAWRVFQNLKAVVKFSGMTRLGLVLVAFGLPVSGEWLAAFRPRGAGKTGAKLEIDSLKRNAAP